MVLVRRRQALFRDLDVMRQHVPRDKQDERGASIWMRMTPDA
jgi:hypothetical protein